MKKTSLLLLTIILSSVSLQAQDLPTDDNTYVYLQILGTAKAFSTKVNVTIDVGDHLKTFADNRMKDPKTGKPKIFNSMIDALNYFGADGWEFAQAYAVTVGNSNVYHYLMKRKRSSIKGLPDAN